MKKNRKNEEQINKAAGTVEDGGKKSKGWYSPAGVKFRKLLCMLAFFGFMAGFYFFMRGVFEFGYDVFDKDNYFKTPSYYNYLEDDIRTLIYNAAFLRKYEDIEWEFSIYDVERGEIYTYSPGSLNASFFTNNLSFKNIYNLDDWIIEKHGVSYDMWDLESAKKFLESKYADRCYLYFSKKSFAEMFKLGGIQNKNKKLSAAHEEDSYFVFYDEGDVLAEQGYSINDDISDIYKYDLSEVAYAVYDPVQDVYYSSWDDFFGPYDQYIYDCEYLREIMNINDMGINAEVFPDETRTNSFIFALLRAENLNDAQNLKNAIKTKRQNYEEAQKYFTQMQDTGILYYLEEGYRIYKSNSIDDIEDLKEHSEYAYVLQTQKEQGVYTDDVVLSSVDAGKIKEGDITSVYSGTHLTCGMAPKDFILYIGIDLDSKPLETDAIFTGYDKWEQVNKYIVPFSVAAVICFLLLIFLAVSMLITTGHQEKGDKEIMLNRFDRLPFELWFVMFGVFIFGSIFANLLVLNGLIDISGIWMEQAFIYGAVSLLFGFAFMEFCLSLARRIKAGNLFANLLVARLFPKNREKKKSITKLGILFRKLIFLVKERYRNSRFKLILWLIVFMMLEYLSFAFMLDYYGHEEFVFGIIISVCIVILAGGMLYSVEKDITSLSLAVDEITKGNLDAKCEIDDTLQLFRDLDDGINHIGDGLKTAIETSLKDERMKTELITNVSHDLKTPLTSIINYIDLLKKEEIPGKDAKHYIEVLESKAQRLKQLTEDLVEAAKATSGNIELEMMPLTFDELMKQALGEFEDKYKTRNLTLIASYPENPVVILADGRRLYRVIENILQNAYKYAMEGTRIYAELSNDNGTITFILKNVSTSPLNISPEELMERFTRGDSSRTTEGSGLGLSIAKDLTKLMDGTFEILLDGDLFKVVITFPVYRKQD